MLLDRIKIQLGELIFANLSLADQIDQLNEELKQRPQKSIEAKKEE